MRKLADWMARKKLDDADVAAQVGCSRVQVSRIRRGVCRPSPALAMRLETLTKIRWHEFIGAAPPPKVKRQAVAVVQ
jgi:transcriptional regulator with XRE-family HTH domain